MRHPLFALLFLIFLFSCEQQDVKKSINGPTVLELASDPVTNHDLSSGARTAETVSLFFVQVRMMRLPEANINDSVIFKLVRVSDKAVLRTARVSVSALYLPTQFSGLGRVINWSANSTLSAGVKYRIEAHYSQPIPFGSSLGNKVLISAYCTCNDPNNYNPYPVAPLTYENAGGFIGTSPGWLLEFYTINKDPNGINYRDQMEPNRNSWLPVDEPGFPWIGQEFIPLACNHKPELVIKNFKLGEYDGNGTYHYSFDIFNAGTEPLDLTQYAMQNWRSNDDTMSTDDAGAGGALLSLHLNPGQAPLKQGESVHIDYYFIVSPDGPTIFYNILDIYNIGTSPECDPVNRVVTSIF